MLQYELPYCPDTSILFARLADLPWAVWLDSCQPQSEQGRFDIISADPIVTLQTQGKITEIARQGRVEYCRDDPLFLLQQELNTFPVQQTSDFPFVGGAIGYFSYDLGRYWASVPNIITASKPLPDMAVAIYNWTLLVDHQTQRCFLLAHETATQAFIHWRNFFQQTASIKPLQAFHLHTQPQANFNQASYTQAFQRIQFYIHEGDCYQVNLAQRFAATAQGHAWHLYLRLREQNPAPFAAFLNTPKAQILSSSPERFLSVHNAQVETKPIKGTRPRCLENLEQDTKVAQTLLNSPKDRAENLMIVDLLRNDLSKVCALGSIRVPHLFSLETFARVHHLVSTVTGQLSDDKTSLDLLRACFPGGSITGAPKLRAMQIIEELELHRREVYCGSIGYIGFDGKMDTNIAIRTLVYANNQLRFWVGGGIVADSEAEAEYAETFAKAEAIFRALESLS